MIFWRGKSAQPRSGATGRHRATGSSLPAFALRAFTSASAHGCIGSVSVFPPAMLMNACGIPPCASIHPRGSVDSLQACLSDSQTPEKSGVLPSMSRGAGALRFGAPEPVRGTFVMTFGHCADGTAVQHPIMPPSTTIRATRCIDAGGSRLGRGALTRAGEHLSAGKRQRFRINQLAAVSREPSLDADGVADFHVIAGPAESNELERAAHFHCPVDDEASRILRVDIDVDVRIGPFKLRHGTRNRDRLHRIELRGKGVMRLNGGATQNDCKQPGSWCPRHCDALTSHQHRPCAAKTFRSRYRRTRAAPCLGSVRACASRSMASYTLWDRRRSAALPGCRRSRLIR